MRLVVIILAFVSLNASGQLYNRVMNLKLSYTSQQLDHMRTIKSHSDTAYNSFELVWQMPAIAYSHEFRFSKIFSIVGNGGWQYMNIFYGHQHYGSQMWYLEVAPQVTLYSRDRFQYYMRVKGGASFWYQNRDLLTGPERGLFPQQVNFIGGITLVGMNFFLGEKWGINTEISILSPEMATIGLTYRFWRGKLPKVQTTYDDGSKE